MVYNEGWISRSIIALVMFFLVSGCATMSSLPKTSNDVNFDSKEGKTGWSKYEESFFFKGVDKRTAHLAAKTGLSDAGFTA